MAVLTVPAATAEDIALVPLMTADDTGVGIAVVVLYADRQVGKYLPQGQGLQLNRALLKPA